MTLEETGLGHVPPKTALQKVFRYLLKWKLKLSQSILKEKFVPEIIQVLCLPQTKYDIGHRPRLEIPKSYYTFRKLFSHGHENDYRCHHVQYCLIARPQICYVK